MVDQYSYIYDTSQGYAGSKQMLYKTTKMHTFMT